ncbi:uncharacterized protein LOC115442362 [Manduca sexta]|uniref:uncharacterized protein LOC115442362 n=1 Tax=Manduca sexta TaxID=7130 RepID=UPI00188E5C94|nr:uncharacterized protein LOC115442362 [Manduca sexta]
MEADSTTQDSNSKELTNEPHLPFIVRTGNFKLYKDLTDQTSEKPLEIQIIERLQSYSLLPGKVICPSNKSSCSVIWKTARVIDRAQWVCEGCGKRQPIRIGSFFFKLQCSILQTLQLILAWCEDADINIAAQHFGVKHKIASQIFDRLDDLAITEQSKCLLGGENSVVLAEMYPDCLNRFSPDTTDQPHVHRILMMADTKHIPTHYCLHVLKEDSRKSKTINIEALKLEVEQIISGCVKQNSMVVTGNNLPSIEGTSSIHKLVQHCDADMQHFLTTRIWRQAVTVCSASRDLCGSAPAAASSCASLVQRYLNTGLYRLRYGDGFYHHILNLIAEQFTEKQND